MVLEHVAAVGDQDRLSPGVLTQGQAEQFARSFGIFYSPDLGTRMVLANALCRAWETRRIERQSSAGGYT